MDRSIDDFEHRLHDAAEDRVEALRRQQCVEVNDAVASDDASAERARLVSQHGDVLDTSEVSRDFEIWAFAAPYVVVRRRADGVDGTLTFQHHPRFYFCFQGER